MVNNTCNIKTRRDILIDIHGLSLEKHKNVMEVKPVNENKLVLLLIIEPLTAMFL
jgi:hypothetical protein